MTKEGNNERLTKEAWAQYKPDVKPATPQDYEKLGLPPTPPTPAGAGTETPEQTLAFFRSVIAGGEAWSQSIDDAFDDAIAKIQGLRRQAEADRAILKEKDIAYEDMKRQRDALLSYQGKNFWIWQGDGCDNIESLTCPIMIKAAELRAIFTQLASADKDRERMDWLEKNWPDIVGRSDRKHVVITCDDFSTELGREKTYRAAIDAALQPSASLDHSEPGEKP